LCEPGQALIHFADSNDWKEVQIGRPGIPERA
jgi:hypothetical protein